MDWKNLKSIWGLTLIVCFVALGFAFAVIPLGFGGIAIKLAEIYLLTRTNVKKFFSNYKKESFTK